MHLPQLVDTNPDQKRPFEALSDKVHKSILINFLSFFVEDSPVSTRDVVDIAQELDFFLLDSDELEEEFGSKDWISHAVYLFNRQINYHSVVSLEEYFS